MAVVAFVGRVLFVSVFILSAWQEFNGFGTDGGPAAHLLVPKFNVFSKHVSSQTGFQVPHFEMKHAVAAAMSVKGFREAYFSSLAVLLELIFCFCISSSPPQYCMIFTTMMPTQRNLICSLQSLHRTWHCLGHCSFSLA
ncbi:hypothetical protein OIU84_018716 [Salix udensis]|uniref:CASP-like protein n=1 Tax=Salix udensis TaxID=889485 RepID=A0AAD6KXB5_9ROSI|nr:hypothetical protein OIU84_018716 [Salix udensis]